MGSSQKSYLYVQTYKHDVQPLQLWVILAWKMTIAFDVTDNSLRVGKLALCQQPRPSILHLSKAKFTEVRNIKAKIDTPASCDLWKPVL